MSNSEQEVVNENTVDKDKDAVVHLIMYGIFLADINNNSDPDMERVEEFINMMKVEENNKYLALKQMVINQLVDSSKSRSVAS